MPTQVFHKPISNQKVHTKFHSHPNTIHTQASRTPEQTPRQAPRSPSSFGISTRIHALQDPFAEDNSGLRIVYEDLRDKMRQHTPDTKVRIFVGRISISIHTFAWLHDLQIFLFNSAFFQTHIPV
jgi:hypothetical protein